MWTTPPLADQMLSNTPLRLHTIEMILTMCLAHVFLVSYYEWKIHNYLFQKTSLFALQRA